MMRVERIQAIPHLRYATGNELRGKLALLCYLTMVFVSQKMLVEVLVACLDVRQVLLYLCGDSLPEQVLRALVG